MQRRCSSASATLRSVEALQLGFDCKQLCDSRTMQRGINYLQRARPHEQLSTGKVDLTHDGVHLGNLRVLFFRAHADGSVPDKPAASPPRHMGALDDSVRAPSAGVVVARGSAPCLCAARPRVPAPARARPDHINSRAAIRAPPAAALQNLWRNRPNSRIASKAVKQTPRRLGG